MRVEIIASMGVGKTTLCKAFEKADDFHCIYEDVAENPFLEKRIDHPEFYAFPAQMWFMVNKYTALQEKADPNKINVFDYSMLSEMAFINTQKSAEKSLVDLCQKNLDYMIEKCGHADVVLYLKSKVENQAQRIQERNRSFEKNLGVDMEYLKALQIEFEKAAETAKENNVHLIEIDTDVIDFRSNLKAIEIIQNRIRPFKK